MKRIIHNFRFTIAFMVAAATCWMSVQFAGTVCTERSRQIPELGYPCISTRPSTFGMVLLLMGVVLFIASVASLALEFLKLSKKA